jgi:hypothetical protein
MAQGTSLETGFESGREAPARPDGNGRSWQKVQSFLDEFSRGFTSGDGPAVAALWDTPALILSDQGVHAVSSRDELAAFFGGAKAQYTSQGVTDTRAEIIRLSWPTDQIAIVEVRWPYLDQAGRSHGHETSTYTLRRDDNGALKLRVAVMHGTARND